MVREYTQSYVLAKSLTEHWWLTTFWVCTCTCTDYVTKSPLIDKLCTTRSTLQWDHALSGDHAQLVTSWPNFDTDGAPYSCTTCGWSFIAHTGFHTNTRLDSRTDRHPGQLMYQNPRRGPTVLYGKLATWTSIKCTLLCWRSLQPSCWDTQSVVSNWSHRRKPKDWDGSRLSSLFQLVCSTIWPSLTSLLSIGHFYWEYSSPRLSCSSAWRWAVSLSRDDLTSRGPDCLLSLQRSPTTLRSDCPSVRKLIFRCVCKDMYYKFLRVENKRYIRFFQSINFSIQHIPPGS